MAKQIKVSTNKTYATEQNAVKVVEKLNLPDNLRYIVLQTPEGRFYPVFVGESAIEAQLHFHFCVIN